MEGEIGMARFIGEHTTIPVPRVISWSSDANLIGYEYILMERAPGMMLERYCGEKSTEKLSSEVWRNLLDQIAFIVYEMKRFTFEFIGGIYLDTPELRQKVNGKEFGYVGYILGKHHAHGGELGPFENFDQFLRATFSLASKKVGESPQLYGELCNVQEKAVKLLDRLESSKNLPRPRISAAHCDFEPRNMLFDPNTGKITAVIDWEWGGSLVEDEDWILGFSFLTDIKPSDGPTDTDWKGIFYQKLDKLGCLTPETMAGHQLRRSLFDLRENLAPWWLNNYDVKDREQKAKLEEDIQAAIQTSEMLTKQIGSSLRTDFGV